MEIINAQFTISSPHVDKCPASTEPEYAFIGRSNVGKSSLINMLCRHKGLAKTSSTPGKTMLINHFHIESAPKPMSDKRDRWNIVDLPGYGYAKRSKKQQHELEQMTAGYILQRQQLTCVFVLIDIRHSQQLIDREFIDWLGESQVPFAIVFTKADKLGSVRAKQNAEEWMEALRNIWENLPPYFITSSEKGIGRDDLLDYIAQINASL